MNETLLRNALHLRRAGKLAEAAEIYGQILSGEPRHFEALHALGIVRYQAGKFEEAEHLIGRAVEVNPRAADAAYNRACVLQKLNRVPEAIVFFDQAIAVKPDYIEALANRGSALVSLQRADEALSSFDRVIALKPEIAEIWNNRARALLMLGRPEAALESYDRAVALKPNYAEALKNRGSILIALQRCENALADFDKAVQFAPNDADAWHGKGLALSGLMKRNEALPSFNKAYTLDPANAKYRISRANMLFEMERFEEAARDYEILLTGESPPSWMAGYLTLCRLHSCDWRALDSERARISAHIRAGRYVVDPTGNALISSSLEEQLQCGRIWTAGKAPPAPIALWTGEKYRHDRIRLAYLSADFRAHATTFLMAGVFEQHDRNRFDTVAISYSTDDKSPMRARVESAFGRFIDVVSKTDVEVARLMRDMEIDVAVDLKGHTNEGRPGILAHRPAPVQAQYLGFPGTMSTDYVDYIIADPVVIAPEHRAFYSEKIAYLPDSYQCNDRQRRVAERAPTRLEAGLPLTGVVFCCFNNNHKITPEIFDIWMRLLRNVEGSVLWLLQDNAAVGANLRREAQARGVAADRIVFAPRTDPPAHLARHRLADVFLDTLPYNAHTTASDALWAGLPLITLLGPTFAGRVAASLLRATGMPELITNSADEYEVLALKLARDPATLAGLKQKLTRNRDTCALFDTARITRNLEAAYITMWERQQRGLPPETFAVPASRPS